MLKHVGRHNNREVYIVFRELPNNQEHMALVVYTDTLPTATLAVVQQALKSPAGQATNEFSEALSAAKLPDGSDALNVLHSNGWLKKVQTKQVIVVPNAKSQVRLDEINDIVNKLKVGGEGAQELANLDAQAGMYDPANKAVDVQQFASEQVEPAEQSSPAEILEAASNSPAEPSTIENNIPLHSGVLDNNTLAKNNIIQAEQMEAQIKSLTEEAARLKTEAYEMAPALKPKRKYVRKAKAKVDA